MVRLWPCFYSVARLKMSRENPPIGCQPAKLIVREVAAQLGISVRHLIRIAPRIPGLEKGPNGHNFNWRKVPKTMKWIRNEVRIRKGGKKRPQKHKARPSNAQRFSRVIGRVEKMVLSHLKPALEEPTMSELRNLDRAEWRLKRLYDLVKLRILVAHSQHSTRERSKLW